MDDRRGDIFHPGDRGSKPCRPGWEWTRDWRRGALESQLCDRRGRDVLADVARLVECPLVDLVGLRLLHRLNDVVILHLADPRERHEQCNGNRDPAVEAVALARSRGESRSARPCFRERLRNHILAVRLGDHRRSAVLKRTIDAVAVAGCKDGTYS